MYRSAQRGKVSTWLKGTFYILQIREVNEKKGKLPYFTLYPCLKLRCRCLQSQTSGINKISTFHPKKSRAKLNITRNIMWHKYRHSKLTKFSGFILWLLYSFFLKHFLWSAIDKLEVMDSIWELPDRDNISNLNNLKRAYNFRDLLAGH